MNGFVSPVPRATWTLPSSDARPAVTEFDSTDSFGLNNGLEIDNDGDPIAILNDIIGTYMCTLSNSMGSDTAMTELSK